MEMSFSGDPNAAAVVINDKDSRHREPVPIRGDLAALKKSERFRKAAFHKSRAAGSSFVYCLSNILSVFYRTTTFLATNIADHVYAM